MIYSGKASKIRLYVNDKKKSAAQIRTETGCDIVINAGLFDMKTFKPCCKLKVDGKILADDGYKYWGYAIKDGSLILTEAFSGYENYIACCNIVKAGAAAEMIYQPEMGGARQRTAIGRFKDGRIWIYADKSAKTPAQLRTIALTAGVESAIMLDGGASTQIATMSGAGITGSRRVHNLICIWGICTWAEPTSNVRKWSVGLPAKWVQWHLKQWGYDLAIDGLFYNDSTKALLDFQKKHGLDIDGICGPATRAVLKTFSDPQPEEEIPDIVSIDYTKISPHKVIRTSKIDTITIHHMASTMTLEQCGTAFSSERQASSNYGIKDKRIAVYVPENYRSMCSSNAKNDDRAITVEVGNSKAEYPWPVSPESIETLIKLCVDICNRYGFPYLEYDKSMQKIGKPYQITLHRWFTATQCPGDYLVSHMDDICKEINERLMPDDDYKSYSGLLTDD